MAFHSAGIGLANVGSGEIFRLNLIPHKRFMYNLCGFCTITNFRYLHHRKTYSLQKETIVGTEWVPRRNIAMVRARNIFSAICQRCGVNR